MRMQSRSLAPTLIGVLSLACGTPGRDANSGGAADSTAQVVAPIDSVTPTPAEAAEKLLADAKATLAELLADPASARFDSLVAVRPLAADRSGRMPPMAVCGRISGKPGIAGSTSPRRFVYQSRFTVFVEDDQNRAEFGALWSRVCASADGQIVLRG